MACHIPKKIMINFWQSPSLFGLVFGCFGFNSSSAKSCLKFTLHPGEPVYCEPEQGALEVFVECFAEAAA